MTQPLTSMTQAPGYVTNQPALGLATHQQWVDAFVDYWASRWAHGDHRLPAGWSASNYGVPDDQNNNGTASPATLLAFARYAAAYHPGMDTIVDQTLPWVAPSSNDFIEDPVIAAARVAQDNWTATFGQNKSNADRLAWQQQWANDIQRYGYQVQAAGNANDFAANLFQAASGNWQAQQNFARGVYDTQVGARNSDNQVGANLYGTQAGMYNANEGNKAAALGQAGSLASQLQQMWDARTQNAIDKSASPNDFIARESAVRALTAPTGTDVPAYSNVDALQEVINRLIHYTPGAQPTAPQLAGMPIAPTMTQAPTAPTYGQGAGAMPAVPTPTSLQQYLAANPMNSETAAIRPPAGDSGGLTWRPLDAGESNGFDAAPQTTSYGPGGNVLGQTVQHSAPGIGADTYQLDTSGNPMADLTKAMGQPHKYLAHGGTTSSGSFVSGDPQSDGYPNPELVEILHPGPKTRARVTPLKIALRNLPRFAYGTQLGARADPVYNSAPDSLTKTLAGYGGSGIGSGLTTSGPQSAPQMTLRSYPDSAYNQLPSLRYFQGNMSRPQYNTLQTGTAQGAFGTQAPESGSINYGRYLDVAKDPISLALLNSIYNSANRDLASEVSRAKARAPFGQAVNTSLVRT